MPTLLELQQAMRGRLIGGDTAITAMLADGVASDRLDIYRNTALHTLTKALRLSYPAVCRLVGEEFFNGAAEVFIGAQLPTAAWLDRYSGDFAEFLQHFEPAQALPYLADVARLEWAVNLALHAPDAEPVDIQAMALAAANDASHVRFIAHPSVGCLHVKYPADAIWRAVLTRDDAAMAAIDLGAGAANLLVERRDGEVEVTRLDEQRWKFADALLTGRSLSASLEAAGDADATIWLAAHLGAGHFAGFELGDAGCGLSASEHEQ